MIVDHLLVLTGTLTRTTDGDETDAYNMPTEETTTAEVRCWLTQANASDTTGNANLQTEDLVVYLPGGTEVSGRDRLTVDGAVYEFTGPPWSAQNPLMGGASAFVQVGARRVS